MRCARCSRKDNPYDRRKRRYEREREREREREMKYTFEFFEPATYVLECTSPADVIHDKSSDRASVIRGSHSTEPLLTCRIPDLRLDFLSFNLHALRLKLHADGSLGVVVELVARVSREQIWFPHRRVTDEYDLEEVIFALIIVVRHFFLLLFREPTRKANY